MGVTTWTIWGVLPWYRKLTAAFTLTLFIGMIGLNVYWFALIVKGLRKLLQSKGIIKREDKGDSYQIVE
jgi:hypothetical protein